MIDTIYLEDEVRGHPRTKRILARYPDAEVIPCERSTPNDIVDDYDMRQVIRWSMECLDEREFFICQLYYGFDGSDGLSLLEISEKMGISRQHCSVIHIEAKAKLAKAAYHYGYQPTRLQ